MWESPINIIYKNVEESLENGILKAIQKTDIIVDKKELVKALQYDRDQYRKGYEDAVLDKTHGHWIKDRLCTTSGGTYGVRRCSVCEDYFQDVGYGWNYCPNCGADMRGGNNDGR